jgi:hypothetical protein
MDRTAAAIAAGQKRALCFASQRSAVSDNKHAGFQGGVCPDMRRIQPKGFCGPMTCLVHLRTQPPIRKGKK